MAGNRAQLLRTDMLAVFGAAVLAAMTGARASGTGVQGQAVAAGRPVQNAVIWLDAPSAPKASQSHRVVLDQRNLTFYPHVLAIRVGTTVDFPNNDRVFHNVFSFKNGKRFDLGLYPVVARIFAVADTLDAITSDRPYRRASSFADALDEIERVAGTQFDPTVVTALRGLIEELERWRRDVQPDEALSASVTGPAPELAISL